MHRLIYEKLQCWKNDNKRKPLIIDGARQVGKTWIIKKFGTNEYKNKAYINCDKVVEMKNIFYDYDIKRLVRAFSSITQETIVPGETLIVLGFKAGILGNSITVDESVRMPEHVL